MEFVYDDQDLETYLRVRNNMISLMSSRSDVRKNVREGKISEKPLDSRGRRECIVIIHPNCPCLLKP